MLHDSLDAFLGSLDITDCEQPPFTDLGDGFKYYLQPTRLPPQFAELFAEPNTISTHLPYRISNVRIPSLEFADPSISLATTSGVMLSEDVVIIVKV